MENRIIQKKTEQYFFSILSLLCKLMDCSKFQVNGVANFKAAHKFKNKADEVLCMIHSPVAHN
jgi:hypothetical protein